MTPRPPSRGRHPTQDAAARPGMRPRCSVATAPGTAASQLRTCGAGRDGTGPCLPVLRAPSSSDRAPRPAAAAPSEGRCVSRGRRGAAPPPPGPARPGPPPAPRPAALGRAGGGAQPRRTDGQTDRKTITYTRCGLVSSVGCSPALMLPSPKQPPPDTFRQSESYIGASEIILFSPVKDGYLPSR